MKYSILPHAVNMLLLLDLASCFKGHLNQHYENLLILSGIVGFALIVLDVMCQECVIACLIPEGPKKNISNQPRPRWQLFANIVHLIGYTVSIGFLGFRVVNHFSTPEKEKFHYCLPTLLIFYPTLMGVMNIIVWKCTHNVQTCVLDLIRQQWIKVVEIIFSFAVGLMALICKIQEKDEHSWMLNLIYLVVVIIFFKFFNEIVGCLPDNDVVQVERYLHMFYKVARKYFRVIVGFLPFLCAFASCFQGKILFK